MAPGSLTVRVCEVFLEDKAPYGIHSCEAAWVLLWAHGGLSYPEPAGLLCSSEAVLRPTSVRKRPGLFWWQAGFEGLSEQA